MPWVKFPSFQHHKTNRHFYHPIKWSPLLDINNPAGVQNYTKFLCNTVLPHLHPPK